MNSQRAGHERAHLAREFLASGLYMSIVLFAALVAVPPSALPSDLEVVLVILGSSVGLTAAHWFAFQLATETTTSTIGSHHVAGEAVALLLGGLAVAVLTCLPFLFADGETAQDLALFELALMPAAAGVAIGRARRMSWPASIAVGLAVLLIGLAVAILKLALTH